MALPRRARAGRRRRAGSCGASDHLTTSGRRALSRQDFGAARTCSSAPPRSCPTAEVDVPLELSIVLALGWRGQAAAKRFGGRVRSPSVPPPRAIGWASSARGSRRLSNVLMSSRRVRWSRLAALAEQALPLFEAAGDDFALHVATGRSGTSRTVAGRWTRSAEAFERAGPTLGGRVSRRDSRGAGR